MSDSLKRSLRKVLFAVSALLISAVCGVVLLWLAYMIPVDPIRENVRDSAHIYDEEGLTTSYVPWLTSTRRDNYTDSIMLSEAAYKGSGHALNKALLSPYIYVTQKESYSQPGYLLKMLDAAEDGSSVLVTYARYWHGYLIFLKPALLFTGLGGIRVINAVFQGVMLLLVGYELLKVKERRKLFIPFLLLLFVINPVSTFINMQYASIYNITLVSIFILLKRELYDSDGYWKLFLFTGIAVAFFDFLTYPVVSLGIPLILILVLGSSGSKANLIKVIGASVSWGFGYAAMWLSKWVICDIITGSNTVTNAINQVVERTVTNAYEETGIMSDNVAAVIGYNLEAFRDPLSVSVFALAVTGFVLYVVFGRKKIKPDERTLVPLMLIALFPFVWYAVLSNHSAIHFWMTYRNLGVPIFAVSAIASCSICESK